MVYHHHHWFHCWRSQQHPSVPTGSLTDTVQAHRVTIHIHSNLENFKFDFFFCMTVDAPTQNYGLTYGSRMVIFPRSRRSLYVEGRQAPSIQPTIRPLSRCPRTLHYRTDAWPCWLLVAWWHNQSFSKRASHTSKILSLTFGANGPDWIGDEVLVANGAFVAVQYRLGLRTI